MSLIKIKIYLILTDLNKMLKKKKYRLKLSELYTN